jgi:hypothetical protein
MQDPKLMDYFKFDEADLEANRKGEFSEAQKKRLFKGLFAPKKFNFYKAEGAISIQAYRTDARSPADHTSLHVGEKQFDEKEDLLNIMAIGDVYAVYYCNAVQSDAHAIDSWDKVLSVELISKTK